MKGLAPNRGCSRTDITVGDIVKRMPGGLKFRAGNSFWGTIGERRMGEVSIWEKKTF